MIQRAHVAEARQEGPQPPVETNRIHIQTCGDTPSNTSPGIKREPKGRQDGPRQVTAHQDQQIHQAAVPNKQSHEGHTRVWKREDKQAHEEWQAR